MQPHKVVIRAPPLEVQGELAERLSHTPRAARQTGNGAADGQWDKLGARLTGDPQPGGLDSTTELEAKFVELDVS